jgi:hypothetical protein
VVWAPLAPSDIALLPITSLKHENPKSISIDPRKVPQRRRHRRPISGKHENPKSISIDPRKVPQRRRHRRPISGDRCLCFGTLPGRGIALKAISIDSTAIFITVAVSHDEEEVVLP